MEQRATKGKGKGSTQRIHKGRRKGKESDETKEGSKEKAQIEKAIAKQKGKTDPTSLFLLPFKRL